MKSSSACLAVLAIVGIGFLIGGLAINSQDPVPPNVPGGDPAVPVKGPVIYDTLGPWSTWGALGQLQGDYYYQTICIDTTADHETGGRCIPMKLIPFSQMPFAVPDSALVIVYQSEFGFTYGYMVLDGWWVMMYTTAFRDPIIIDELLDLAEV